MRKAFVVFLFCFVLFSSPLSALDLTPSADTVQTTVIPYAWGKTRGTLVDAVKDTQATGAKGMRAYIGPYFRYQSQSMPVSTPLAELLRDDPQYQYLMRAGLKKVFFTCYDSASYYNKYRYDTFSETDAAAVQEEFRLFAFEASMEADRFGVEIYCSNWEAYHDAPDVKTWPKYVRYIQARVDGWRQGRAQAVVEGGSPKVWIVGEFIYLDDVKEHPSDLRQVLTKVKGLDAISYSSWESISPWFNDPQYVRESYEWAFVEIRDVVFKNPDLPNRIIIGELGNNWGQHPNPAIVETIVRVSIEQGAELVVPWNLYDQPGDVDPVYGWDASLFGIYDITGQLTIQGSMYLRWYLLGLVSDPIFSSPVFGPANQ